MILRRTSAYRSAILSTIYVELTLMSNTVMAKGKDTKKAVQVKFDSLKVLMCEDAGFWFAQGLDVDYAAYGKTIDEAKQNFEDGMVATIHEHLKMYGSLVHFLKPAPKEEWASVYTKAYTLEGQSTHCLEDEESGFSDVSDDFPFGAIAYSKTNVSCAA